MNILFIENHEAFAKTVISEFLGEHEVFLVGDIDSAIDIFNGVGFDLVIADYDLDSDQGADVISIIRCQNKSIPIIALSSYTDGDSLLKAGASGFCEKINVHSISEVIDSVVSKKRFNWI